jgi:hypothetical protein
LLHEPEIITRGFVSPEEATSLIPDVRKLIMRVVHNDGFDDEKDIINAVRYLHQQTKRRPMVFVTLSKRNHKQSDSHFKVTVTFYFSRNLPIHLPHRVIFQLAQLHPFQIFIFGDETFHIETR